MHFALTDEQQEFGAAVAGWLAAEFSYDAVRAVVEDTGGDGRPATLWSAAAEQGWLAVLVDEAHDGLGLGVLEAQGIARALGAGIAPGPWRGTVLAADAIGRAGSDAQRASWLPRLAAGDAVGAVAERGSVGEPGRAGELTGVEYGALADVVVAPTADGGLALVTGASATPRGSYDGTVRLADLSGGEVEPLPGADAAAAAELADRAAVLVAADLVGVARAALTRTVAYDRERSQFGVPVGSFQAIKHALADLHVAVTMAEHAVLYAAHTADTGTDDRAQAVAVAAAKSADTALAATGAMIQYHGGIGYTWEHEAHLYYKRAKRLAGHGGGPAAYRRRLAELTVGALG